MNDSFSFRLFYGVNFSRDKLLKNLFFFFSLLSFQMSFWDHRDHPDVIPSASSALLFLSYSFYPSFIPLVRLEGVLSGNLLD